MIGAFGNNLEHVNFLETKNHEILIPFTYASSKEKNERCKLNSLKALAWKISIGMEVMSRHFDEDIKKYFLTKFRLNLNHI